MPQLLRLKLFPRPSANTATRVAARGRLGCHTAILPGRFCCIAQVRAYQALGHGGSGKPMGTPSELLEQQSFVMKGLLQKRNRMVL